MIKEIHRDCTCTEYVTSLNFMIGEGPPSRSHMHLICEYLEEPSKGKKAYLNGYNDNLESVWNSDRLTVLVQKPVQITMDFKKNNALDAKNGGRPITNSTTDAGN